MNKLGLVYRNAQNRLSPFARVYYSSAHIYLVPNTVTNTALERFSIRDERQHGVVKVTQRVEDDEVNVPSGYRLVTVSQDSEGRVWARDLE